MYILLLEDDPEMAFVLSEALQLDNHTVQFDHNGQEGLARLRSADVPPDVIICDIQMPIMDGLDFTRYIRQSERWADIPIVVMSGRPSDKIKALDAGATYFMSKPFKYSHLEQILSECQKR